MRHVIILLLGCVGLITLGVASSHSEPQGGGLPSVFQIPAPSSTGNENMLMHAGMTSTGAQQIVLVDTAKRVMAVYQITPDTGVIQLKSVRNLTFDFQLEEFNSSDPTPSKVRNILSVP